MTSAILSFVTLTSLSLASATGQSEPDVRLRRVPGDGVQPQIVVEGETCHLLSFQGAPEAGDLFYRRVSLDGEVRGAALRVNSQEGSAIAVGTIRGGQMALGADGRLHVAWNGSARAEPKGPKNPAIDADSPYNGLPMLYTRLSDDGAFEPQRNLMTRTFSLDGGGSIAADGHGNVWVAWHASSPQSKAGEAGRRVWLAQSKDSGETFERERPIGEEGLGACGCCGMRLMATRAGDLFALYRAATEGVRRDVVLLAPKDGGDFEARKLHPWRIESCPMSSMSLLAADSRVLCAWETDGQVHYGEFDVASRRVGLVAAAPGDNRSRKHPVLARNEAGQVLLAWSEGTGWQKGGAVAWQVFDAEGKPTANRGREEGVPVWGSVTAFSRPDGDFVILY
ncbi:MAG: hypothetical protein RL885_29480 [Planctomycetota bacterium]